MPWCDADSGAAAESSLASPSTSLPHVWVWRAGVPRTRGHLEGKGDVKETVESSPGHSALLMRLFPGLRPCSLTPSFLVASACEQCALPHLSLWEGCPVRGIAPLPPGCSVLRTWAQPLGQAPYRFLERQCHYWPRVRTSRFSDYQLMMGEHAASEGIPAPCCGETPAQVAA